MKGALSIYHQFHDLIFTFFVVSEMTDIYEPSVIEAASRSPRVFYILQAFRHCSKMGELCRSSQTRPQYHLLLLNPRETSVSVDCSPL
jgi:hypothetical protein